jgi:hypothetical protein
MAMAKHRSHILEMARKGAEHKYEELKADLTTLVRNFPHLAARKGRQVSRAASNALAKGGAAVMAAVSGEAPKKRRKMSAKARKAIGDAQRKRWAKKKRAEAVVMKKS